ncbi:MAG: hypothetical protein ABSA47_04325, partial [Verrucomicrobiota bacterium]
MNTIRFLFTLIAFGSFSLGLSYADEPSRQVPMQDNKTTEHSSDSATGKPTPGKTAPTDGEASNPKDDVLTDQRPGKPTAGKTIPTDGKLPKADGHASAKGTQPGPLNPQPKITPPTKLPQPSAASPPPASASKSAPANAPPSPSSNPAAPSAKSGSSIVGSTLNKSGPQSPAKLPGGDGTTPIGVGGVRGRGATAALLGASLGLGPKNAPAALVG